MRLLLRYQSYPSFLGPTACQGSQAGGGLLVDGQRYCAWVLPFNWINGCTAFASSAMTIAVRMQAADSLDDASIARRA